MVVGIRLVGREKNRSNTPCVKNILKLLSTGQFTACNVRESGSLNQFKRLPYHNFGNTAFMEIRFLVAYCCKLI